MIGKRANGTERALDLIEALSDADAPLSRAQLAQITGMPRSTVYTLSDLLIGRGWLIEQQGGQILLGPKAGFVSNRYIHQHGLDALARQVLSDLSRRTGHPCEIDILDRWEHVVAISEGRIASGYLRPVEGARLPLMPTAAARVILSDVPEAILRARIDQALLRDAANGPLAWERFFQEAQEGLLRGYVTVEGWLGGTVSTLACPVHAASRQIVASVCMILPGSKAAPFLDTCLPPLQEAAEKLTGIVQRLGWPAAENGKSLMCAE